jgi:ferredoxin
MGDEPAARDPREIDMASVQDRWEDNVPGEWYVDRSCILCSLCSELAPRNFRESDDGDHDIVYRQPQDSDEVSACHDAMTQCPVEAIGVANQDAA